MKTTGINEKNEGYGIYLIGAYGPKQIFNDYKNQV